MKLGIGSYGLMWSIGFEGARPASPLTARHLADEARRLGVRVVQSGPNLPFTREDVAYARTLGVQVELGVAGLDIGDHIHFAGAAGASFVRTVLQEEAIDVPPVSLIETRLRALLPLLENWGVRLGLENSVVPAATLRSLLESIGSPHLGVTLDTVNSLVIGEGWRHVLAVLAPYTRCLHLKDFTVCREWHRMGFRITGTPAGRGDLDVPFLLASLRAAGFSGSVILELWVPEQRTLDETIALERSWAEQSVTYLRTLIQE
jgi:sugar phosphate isomerase/epimerase